MLLPSARLSNCLLTAICLAAMGAVYYLDAVLGLEPCPLCITQRVFLLGCGLCTLAAACHAPALTGRRIYALGAAACAGGGAAFAARHVWLQQLPAEQVPACGPGLAYMLENLPVSKTLALLLRGDGQCAEVVWTVWGLSIPQQSLLLFGALLAANVWQAGRRL